VLQRILERFFPQLLVPTQRANRKDSTWALFYGFDQYLWHPGGDTKQGIGVFFTFGESDGDPNPVKYTYNLGIGGNGVVPGDRATVSASAGHAPSSVTTSCLPCASRPGSVSGARMPSRSSTTRPSPRG
jgi:porin